MAIAIYDERTVVRVLCMRRTLFAVPEDLVAVVHAACTRAIAARERRTVVGWLEGAGIAADGDAHLRGAEEATIAALAERGDAYTTELTAAVPALAEKLVVGQGRLVVTIGLSTRVVFLLAADGRMVRGRPRGTWISTTHRWSLPSPGLAAAFDALEVEEAQARLVVAWLRSFGPGTTTDLRWWTGLTAREVKAALAVAGAVAVDLDGTPGWVTAGDDEPVAAPERWVALLPSLDPTTMGWKERAWYLGAHGAALFDRNGNAGPTVWLDGRVVGGWGQRRSTGEVVVRFLEPVPKAVERAVAAEARRLEAWHDATRVTPRFPTPLETEIRKG